MTFIKMKLTPYLQRVFNDLAMRSFQPKCSGKVPLLIDKNTFCQYTNLPGAVSDRFFAHTTRKNTTFQEYVDLE